MSLENAYDMTLTSDQSIGKAYFEIRKANLQPLSALTKLGPSLTGNASYTNSRSSTHYETSTTSGSNTVTSSSYTRYAGLSYSQTLFDAAVFPAYRYGKLEAKSARLTYKRTVRETLYGVAEAYYNVLKEQKLVEVNQQTVELAKEQLVTAQAKFDAGSVARIDVLRAQATLEDDRSTLIQSQGTLETYRDTLSNILNLGGKTNFTVVEPPDAVDPGTPFELSLFGAFERREDYQVSLISVQQYIAKKGEVIAEYAPKVTASASVEWNGYSGTGYDSNNAKTAAVSVSMPFLTGGQRELDLISANHDISEARLSLQTAWKTVEEDVKSTWVAVQTDREAIKALKASEASYAQNYTDVQAQYQAGTSTSLDVQQALRDLSNARTSLTNKVYDYQIALRDLKRAEACFEVERVQKAQAMARIKIR
jgi:outer membrane protein TolC